MGEGERLDAREKKKRDIGDRRRKTWLSLLSGLPSPVSDNLILDFLH
jgi:hypothetical protein